MTTQTIKFDSINEDLIVESAIKILSSRMKQANVCLMDPFAIKNYLTLQLGLRDAEVFAVIFLNMNGAVISYKEMFNGTLQHVYVYIREVVREALRLNASSVVICHNHPTGNPWPSDDDVKLTTDITAALGLVDIKVVDHIVVAGDEVISFVEEGLIL